MNYAEAEAQLMAQFYAQLGDQEPTPPHPTASRRAEVRARKLLSELISPSNFAHYEAHAEVQWLGKRGLYSIGAHFLNLRAHTVSPKPESLCIQWATNPGYPPTDKVIAILLALQADEEWVYEKGTEMLNHLTFSDERQAFRMRVSTS